MTPESNVGLPAGPEDVLVLPTTPVPAPAAPPAEQVELPLELLDDPPPPGPAARPPNLYPLRPQGVRPVVRPIVRRRGAGGLRNDCPPDRRHPLHPPAPRTRLR